MHSHFTFHKYGIIYDGLYEGYTPTRTCYISNYRVMTTVGQIEERTDTESAKAIGNRKYRHDGSTYVLERSAWNYDARHARTAPDAADAECMAAG